MCLRMQTLLVFTILWSCGLGLTCLDYNSNIVDWYSIYKIPPIHDSSDWKLEEGLGHYYLDVNNPVWQLSDYGMNQSQQAVYETLNPIYNTQDDDMAYMMYNDQVPISFPVNGDGHTKGVVAFTKTSGFWLIHSVPHFPATKSMGYVWPHSGLKNGQTFLCVSFKYEELGSISQQLLYNQPHVYDFSAPPYVCQDFPSFCDIIKGAAIPGVSSVIQLTSLNGQAFTSFAKSSLFGKDLYVDLVAPNVQQDLLVETWQEGEGGKLTSNCTAAYKVMDVTAINFPEASFKETRDHSKWAITYSDMLGKEKVLTFVSMGMWTCIGDINRMESQFKRGGGTLCLQNPSVWKAFRTCVGDYDRLCSE